MSHAIYTVQPRDEIDGLLGVAFRLYGDAARWPMIYDANQTIIGNNPAVVRAGQHLVIPDLNPQAQPKPQVYCVQIVDIANGLRGIAQRLWGQPERWTELYAINRGAIGDNPQALQPGQWLLIP